MPDYELSPAAEGDLLDIARYTIETWGLAQADKYEASIKNHLHARARGEVRTRTPLDHWPEMKLSRCEHHYVFSLKRGRTPAPSSSALFREKEWISCNACGRG